MQNFEFHNPTRIIFGGQSTGAINNLVPVDARVLILSGGHSAERNGTLSEVRLALAGREIYEFSGIEANPTWETLSSAVALACDKRVSFLLAVGGGSVIDGTKFIAAAAKYSGHSWNILADGGSSVTEALPFGVVLTLPATGSEMNSAAVITRKATKTKAVLQTPFVFPLFSILDPTRTYTLPARQLANGIVDAFVHVAEQYLTWPVEARIQDRLAEGVMQTLVEIGSKVVYEPAQYDSRANLMWAAAMALNGLIGVGVPQDWTTHYIGHELTALYEIDHGRTLAIILPSVMALYRDRKREKLLQYASRIWGIAEGNENERIDLAIKQTRRFFESLGIKTRLSEYGLGQNAVNAVTEQLIKHGMTNLGEHQSITPEQCRTILEACV